ncbi:hypothetical protein M9Y10_004746 [Tritrichomonas musculus]|uniref:Uncharacterized protein n=1 Tax=Tritrichomonas musculus TaxID=1915356 RepID=A0ABR2JKA5_9EUKA
MNADSFKEKILEQSQKLDKIEKEYDDIESRLLDVEQQFYEKQKGIIGLFSGNNPSPSTISEVVDYMNSQYDKLEQKISDMEKYSIVLNDSDHKDDIITSLEDLNNKLSEIVKQYTFQTQLDEIKKLEEELIIKPK